MATASPATQPTQAPAWKVLVEIVDPMTPLTSAQAGAYLSLPPRDLEYANESDPEFIPYEPTDVGRIFRLGDVLVAKSGNPKLVLGGSGPMSREAVEEAMTKRVGPRPAWLDPQHYKSAEEQKKSNSRWRATVEQVGAQAGAVKKSRGRPISIMTAVPGARIHRIRGFSTLGDFLANAWPEDTWIVAIPPHGRPYDFLDSIAAQDGAPWQTMTLIEYLEAIRSGAERDEGVQVAGGGVKDLHHHIEKKP